jgi:hypothetical protein
MRTRTPTIILLKRQLVEEQAQVVCVEVEEDNHAATSTMRRETERARCSACIANKNPVRLGLATSWPNKQCKPVGTSDKVSLSKAK